MGKLGKKRLEVLKAIEEWRDGVQDWVEEISSWRDQDLIHPLHPAHDSSGHQRGRIHLHQTITSHLSAIDEWSHGRGFDLEPLRRLSTDLSIWLDFLTTPQESRLLASLAPQRELERTKHDALLLLSRLQEALLAEPEGGEPASARSQEAGAPKPEEIEGGLPELTDLDKQLLAYIKTHPGKAAGELCAPCGRTSEDAVRQAVKKLKPYGVRSQGRMGYFHSPAHDRSLNHP